MRFKLGFALGFVAGHWWATTSADERRAKLDEAWAGVRDNPRLQRVTDAVARDAHRLGDAVERRMVETTDGAVSSIAHSVEPGDGAGAEASSRSTSSRSGSSRSGSSRSGSSRSGSSRSGSSRSTSSRSGSSRSAKG